MANYNYSTVISAMISRLCCNIDYHNYYNHSRCDSNLLGIETHT